MTSSHRQLGRHPASRAPSDRPFDNPNFEPTEDGIEAALGPAIGPFDMIRGLAVDFDQEWGFYRGSGWMLRIHDARKALLYLTPLRGAFRMSLTVREAERDAFVADSTLAGLRSALESARRVPEGFAVAVDVGGEGDFGPVRSFVEKLIAVRQAETPSSEAERAESGQADARRPSKESQA